MLGCGPAIVIILQHFLWCKFADSIDMDKIIFLLSLRGFCLYVKDANRYLGDIFVVWVVSRAYDSDGIAALDYVYLFKLDFLLSLPYIDERLGVALAHNQSNLGVRCAWCKYWQGSLPLIRMLIYVVLGDLFHALLGP